MKPSRRKKKIEGRIADYEKIQNNKTKKGLIMNVDELTIGEVKEISRLIGNKSEKKIPFECGKSYFMRTVTYHIVGKVKDIIGNFLILENASWIADSGRFSNAIKTGVLDEVEPVGDWMLNMESITDGGEWIHELPTTQK